MDKPTMTLEQALAIKKEMIKQEQDEIRKGTHKQFVLDVDKGRIVCKCGWNAIFLQGGYLCGTITAYPCKYNKL